MRALAGGLAFALLGVLTPFSAPAAAAEAPVSLVVGLHATATDVIDDLADTVDVLTTESLPGAVAVDIPADQVAEATDVLRQNPAVAYVEPDHVATIDVITPNDPSYGTQWGATRTNVDDAWATTRGASSVTVAVVDTGVKRLPDLDPRLLPGYDFVNHDTNPDDDNGHGTGTAGVIGATAGNGIGIAGICWYCKILPVKVLGASGSGSYSDIAEGIRYAADQGADIINLSLGGPADSQLLRDAVTYAAGKGSLVLAAAGNDGSSALHYPAAVPAVIAVGGSTAGDARYPWSNYGSNWVDLAAPGCNPVQGRNGVVGQFCGTSSATPFASGVAALLASTTPAPSAATIRKALTGSATPLAGNWVAASSGRVNAAAAVAALPFWISGPTSGAYVGNSVIVRPHVGAGSGITKVTATLDGVVAATATASPWTLAVDTGDIADAATLTVTAVAGSVHKGTATLRVNADHVAPATGFRFPAASGLVRGTVSIGARASDDAGIGRVELMAGSRVVGTDTTSPYAFRWAASAYRGPVTLTVRAYDRAGNVTLARQRLTVDNVAPAVIVAKAPAGGARGIRKTAYVTARASDTYGISRMELLVNGKVIGRYAGVLRQFPVPTWQFGTAMRVQVRAYDRAGNVGYTPARTWYR